MINNEETQKPSTDHCGGGVQSRDADREEAEKKLASSQYTLFGGETDREKVRKKLARIHYDSEPGITEIFAIRGEPDDEARPDEPIKLLEVNEDTIAAGIMPLGFDPYPTTGMLFRSVIVEVTPEEMEKIQRQELPLPSGWTVCELLPRSEPSEPEYV